MDKFNYIFEGCASETNKYEDIKNDIQKFFIRNGQDANEIEKNQQNLYIYFLKLIYSTNHFKDPVNQYSKFQKHFKPIFQKYIDQK